MGKGIMDRFLVFAYFKHEAGGGWSDFKGAYKTQEGAEKGALHSVFDIQSRHDCAHVVDTERVGIIPEESIVFRISSEEDPLAAQNQRSSAEWSRSTNRGNGERESRQFHKLENRRSRGPVPLLD
jgi:hypothetical protein